MIGIEELKSYDEQDRKGEPTNKETRRAKFRLLGPLSKGHNIVVYIRGSARRTKEFRVYTGRMIPIDNRTRWNSWYNILVVLLNLRPAVKKYCTEYKEELKDNILSH